MNDQEKELINAVIKVSRYTLYMAVITVALMIILIVTLFNPGNSQTTTSPQLSVAKQIPVPAPETREEEKPRAVPADAWKAPDSGSIPHDKNGEMIRYGRELLAHTSKYFGPKGSIAQITNGMNCQNCHLDGGSRLYGNNYAGFMASYPKMSNRSGRVEQPAERIAECFERSLAGTVPDTAKKEVQAMLAYMKWIGKDVKKGQKLFGNATEKLIFMNEAANPLNGREVFLSKCQSCHGQNGEGTLAADKKTFINPPLWGQHSYNDAAGMYRLTNLAGFVKNNMPYGATYQNPQLTDQEAWDVAAFINAQPRPHKNQHKDWANLDRKPIDYPFGPYLDGFGEKQHKFGPFKPIQDAQKKSL